MRYSKMFGKSRHNPPCDADSVNAKYLTQAGFIEKMAAGTYYFMPLGLRVLNKVIQIVREEMNSIDGQEVLMPALIPISYWETTGRDNVDIGFETLGHGGKRHILGWSHEEAITPLVKQHIQSYKDLPLAAYQFQTKFRNEPRAKSGILRGREFGMKDMYSFHLNEDDLDEYYDKASAAYTRVFERCGLKTHIIEASGGAFSDQISHEFSVETPIGEDTIILCEECGFAQNLEVATGKVVEVSDEDDELEMKKVEVDKKEGTVEEDCKIHATDAAHVLKTVVFEVEEKGLVGVVIRGDLQVNETKVEKYFKKKLRPASKATIEKAGLVHGYISPVNLADDIGLHFVADHSITNVKNFVTGANEDKQDYVNVNIGRDFVIDDFADFVEVREGFACPNCGDNFKEMQAIEVGNIFKLGTKYSEAFNLKVNDKEGNLIPLVMGCYGIGTTRLVGTIVEASHDDKGIIWPKSVAPYQVHLISLGNDETVSAGAEKLYEDLNNAGVEVLFDDREGSPGVKFNDADLIGIPIRIVISKRTLEKDSVEWKLRVHEESKNVELSDVLQEVEKFLNE